MDNVQDTYISAKIVHLFNYREVITKAAGFRGSLTIRSVQVCCQTLPDLSSFGRNVLTGKHFVIQRWR